MNSSSLSMIGLAAIVAVLMPAAAQAQYYYGAGYRQPPPLYPYELQPNQPYAVQVAPNTYVIRRPAEPRAVVRSARAPKSGRPSKRNDPALVEELRRRHSVKREVINTVKVVRDPPVVIETKRYVDHPPRIVERRHYVDDTAPAPAPRKQKVTIEERETGKGGRRDDTKKRVISAEAEITILGPDRMNIRLFRKRSHSGGATARAE